MSMLVDCSNCLTPLQLPPGAQIIRCGLCDAVTRIAGASRSLTSPSPRQSPSSSSSHAPSPSSHAPPPPQSAHGRKRAVVCAVLYKRSRHELKGCINDAKCMKYLLVNKFKFPESSILMLTEMGGTYGRTIVLDQVFGREQVVVRPFPSVDATMIRPLLIPQLCQRLLQLVP